MQGTFNFEFLPLKVGEFEGRLELVNTDLGSFLYDMKLTASAPGPEKALYFRAALGGNHSLTARFLNFVKLKAEYSCTVSAR